VAVHTKQVRAVLRKKDLAILAQTPLVGVPGGTDSFDSNNNRDRSDLNISPRLVVTYYFVLTVHQAYVLVLIEQAVDKAYSLGHFQNYFVYFHVVLW
jgi:hypothetical protein